MSDFNLHKWFKTQYLQENDDPKMGAELEAGMHGTGVAEAQGDLYSALSVAIPEDTSYRDFAKAVAKMLINDYGSHNFKPFMDVLHSELGINESLNKEVNPLKQEFEDKFGYRISISPYYIEIFTKGDIDQGKFEEMIKWVESKGYKVNKNSSNNWYDNDPGERDYFPRIQFNK